MREWGIVMQFGMSMFMKILSMFMTGTVGFLCVRTKLLKTADSKTLAALLLYIISPCCLFYSFCIEYSTEKLKCLGIAFLFAVLAHIIFLIMAEILRRSGRFTDVEYVSMIYPNCGNLIVPLLMSLLGQEAVFYLSAFLMVNGTVFWTHGYQALSGKKGFSLKQMLNPNILAIGLGFLVFISRITLPSVVLDAVDSIGGTIGTLNMIVIGMMIAGMNGKKCLGRLTMWVTCAIRLLLMPAVVLLVVSILWPVIGRSEWSVICAVSLIASSGPAASNITNVVIMFRGCGEEAEAASTLNVVSTILCIVTMPLMIIAAQEVIGTIM